MFISENIVIDEACISEEFVRSSGPGGQNVNKVATAVCLKFDLKACAFDPGVKERIRRIANHRLNLRDEIVIFSGDYRSQRRNREEARRRLKALIKKSMFLPAKRKKTKKTKSSELKRLKTKRMRGEKKKNRQKVICTS